VGVWQCDAERTHQLADLAADVQAIRQFAAEDADMGVLTPYFHHVFTRQVQKIAAAA
jgi:hypothetical protein